MKNTKRIIAFLVSALMIFSLCSCSFYEERIDAEGDVAENGKKEENKVQAESETEQNQSEKVTKMSKSELEALAAAALEKLAELPEYPEGYPTLDDVVAQYKKANEAIGWIVNTEKVATDSDYTLERDGLTYSKVLPDCYLGADKAGKDENAQKLIYNKKTLEAYFATLITPEEAHDYILDITESFDVPKFIEDKNGELYALPYAFSPEGYGKDEAYELKDNGDGSYTLAVHYTTLDEDNKVDAELTYNVRYINLDGRWLFENFRVVKQH